MGFKEDFAAMMKRAAGKEDVYIRASALALGSAIVAKSPVDTGRFKGNWQYGAGAVNFAVDASPNKAPLNDPGDISKISLGLQGWKRGQNIFITNSLPYAKRLEYDAWSKQAVAGMVRISVMDWKAQLKQQAASL